MKRQASIRPEGKGSNQLNYVPTRQINEMRNRQCLYGLARFAYRALVAPDYSGAILWSELALQTASRLGISVHFCDFQTASTELPAIQSSVNLGKTISKLSQTLSQKYPNSFAEHERPPHFLVGLNEILKFRRTQDTAIQAERRPPLCEAEAARGFVESANYHGIPMRRPTLIPMDCCDLRQPVVSRFEEIQPNRCLLVGQNMKFWAIHQRWSWSLSCSV